MSIHNLPAGIDEDTARFLASRVRAPSGIVYGNGDNNPPTAVEFTPDLSASELSALQEIALRYSDAKADYLQYETYRAQLKTYLGLVSPTAAQSATALKVVIRIVIYMVDMLVRQKL